MEQNGAGPGSHRAAGKANALTARAYSELYLDDAMLSLGEAIEHAVFACGMDADIFMRLFVSSGFADRFGHGDPRIVGGMGGTELAARTLEKMGYEADAPPLGYAPPTPYHWCGWILALYQWASSRSFRDIMSRISVEELLRMHPALHEASEWKAVEAIDRAVRSKDKRTNLQARRIAAEMTQKMLSEESGINLRTLQQYETGAKSINRASGEALRALSRVLRCSMEDLMEPGPVEPFRRIG